LTAERLAIRGKMAAPSVRDANYGRGAGRNSYAEFSWVVVVPRASHLCRPLKKKGGNARDDDDDDDDDEERQ